MRRDYFELEVTNVDWVEEDGEPVQPLIEIEFSGPGDALRKRLSDADGDLLADEDVDVTFRLQDALGEDDAAPGVLAVTNRMTGAYVLELNERAAAVLGLIEAARAYGETEEESSYRMAVSIGGERLVEYEKETLLVYDADGEVRSEESLVPPGVEL